MAMNVLYKILQLPLMPMLTSSEVERDEVDNLLAVIQSVKAKMGEAAQREAHRIVQVPCSVMGRLVHTYVHFQGGRRS